MIRTLLPLGMLVAAAVIARADLFSELSTADQKKVKSGGQVMTTEVLDGYPWPRVRVYQKIEATPREVIAVFTDYNNACHFVPNCLKSEISKKINPLATEVDYVVDVPMLADEAYTVRDTLSAAPGGALMVKWKMLKATSIEESEGNLFAEPFGDNASIIRYTNLVKPSSVAAPLLKGVAMGQMKDTVQAIVDQVGRVKGNPAGLKPHLDRIDAALAK
ncbi:MAG: hypothetical protein ACREKL_13520 [Chthoniobacterales bacterium]